MRYLFTSGYSGLAIIPSTTKQAELVLLPEDISPKNDELFPIGIFHFALFSLCFILIFFQGMFDANNEQLDLRSETTWNTNISQVPYYSYISISSPLALFSIQVSPVELLEVQTVNSTVPFLLISTKKSSKCFVDLVGNIKSEKEFIDSSETQQFSVHH